MESGGVATERSGVKDRSSASLDDGQPIWTRQHRPSQIIRAIIRLGHLPLPDPSPEAADEGGEKGELDEGSGVADLGSILKGVAGLNDNSREPERVVKEFLDRDLG